AALRKLEDQAHEKKYGKLHPLLYDELQRRTPFERIPVGLWLNCNEQPLDKSKYLSAVLTGAGAPLPLLAYRRTVADAKERARSGLAALGVQAPRELLTVPLIMTMATRQQIAAITKLEHIETIYLHRERWVKDLTASLAISRATSVQTVKGYKGKGVRVALWEDSPDPVSSLAFAAYYDPTRRNKSTHSRMVAGIIKNNHPTEPNGYAPECTLFSANLENLEALEWAVVRQECTVINQSFSDYWASNTGSLVLEDRVKDYLANHYPFPTIVQAAGNSGNAAYSGRYYVKPKGYNGIIVGNHDDTASAMSDLSIYRNPDSPSGDRELPDICANGTDVDVLGDVKSGTSFAAPAVTGTVALLQSVDPQLKPRPYACRAILYASAHNVDGDTWFKDVSNLVDAKDGAGALDAFAAVEIAESRQVGNNTAVERGWDGGMLSLKDFDSRDYTRFLYRVLVPASGARHVKVALAWNSRTTDTRASATTKRITTSNLVHDLDLYIWGEGHVVAYSASVDNSYEIAEFDAKPGKTYTVFIARNPSTSIEDVHYGIAWMVHPRA
ncbi:MAG TPA: S8/S53 family peptidase, partial [Pyrinomonadaceae bacterium]|nr:S8/S53 family peptidase [Pyrinomonadaceae bacterium]